VGIPNGMLDSHMFSYIKGKFRYVHTLSVSIGRDSPQSDDLARCVAQTSTPEQSQACQSHAQQGQ
jgi:hypothetical protein